MARIKKARVGIRLDMTPMVDVAFLLLTFFMSTTTFRPPEEVPVDIPDSRSKLKLPTAQVLTIIADHQKQLWLHIEAQSVRQKVFGVGYQKTATRPVTLEELPGFIEMARNGFATIPGGSSDINVILKADRHTDFDVIDRILGVLRDEKITSVHFMTNLEM